MALSGTINGSTSNQYIDCKIVWSATQSVENNTSTITAILYYSRNNTGYTTKGNYQGSITINGVETTDTEYKDIAISYQSNTEAFRATVVVPHNADGTKNVAISATGRINGTSLHSTSLSGTITLNQIERKATITAAPNFNDEENPKITYSNPAGSAVSSLQACISLTGAADDIAYRDISKSGTSYTFNLTDAERNVLRNATKDANNRTVRFYVKTVIGGTTYTSYLTKTLSIVNAVPVINPTAVDVDADMLLLTGDSNKIVKYYSDIQYAINATVKKGATVKSYDITNGENKSTSASGYFYNTDNATVSFKITDSRGNTASKTVNKTLINYVKLSCGLTVAAPTTDGKINFTISGNYFSGSFGATSNSLTVQYRYNTNGGSYGAWVNVSPTISNGTYKGTVSLADFNYLNSYTFQARAFDKITTVESATKTVKTAPIFDWGKNDFNVNGTIGMAGKGTVLRHSTSNNNLVISANSANDGIILRPNGTDSSTGQAIFYKSGNVSIAGNLTTSGNITTSGKINGYNLGTNKLLWSGGYYMTSGHTITLSEAISSQPNGIVLVWSFYDTDTAAPADYYFNSFFIPKYLVSAKPGMEHSFFLTSGNTLNLCAAKSLYINNTTITGEDGNGNGATGGSGIKYYNNLYVLRYVIGV